MTALTPLVKALSEVRCPCVGVSQVVTCTCSGSGRKYNLTEPCPGVPVPKWIGESLMAPSYEITFVHPTEDGCCDGSRTKLVSEEVAALRLLTAFAPPWVLEASKGAVSDLGYRIHVGGSLGSSKPNIIEAILGAAAKLEGITVA